MEKSSNASKAGLWYTIGNIFLKGIVFLSLPIFTRLIDPLNFGIYNNYIAYESIISAILGLGLYSTIKKAYFDFEKNFNDYYVAITNLMIIVFLASFGICFFMRDIIYQFTSFDFKIIVCLLVQSFGSALIMVYASYLHMEFKYKEYLVISLINSLLNIGLSIVLIVLVFPNNSYYGRIIGTAIPYIIFIIYISFFVFSKGKFNFNIKYIKYGLSIGAPLIPHVVAQFILNQSDRIIITKLIGEYESGLYSYAYNICSILYIVFVSIDSAWTPWTYIKYKECKHDIVKMVSTKYLMLSLFIYLGFISLAPDVFKLMAGKNYWNGIEMINPLALSMLFLFLYFIPVNLEYYMKKTFIVSIGTTLAACLNIVLNIFFIPKYGYVAAAYTTLVSYFLLFIIHFFVSFIFNIKKCYKVKNIVLCVVIAMIFTIILEISRINIFSDYIIRYLLLSCDIVCICFCFKKDIKKIVERRKNGKNKKNIVS